MVDGVARRPNWLRISGPLEEGPADREVVLHRGLGGAHERHDAILAVLARHQHDEPPAEVNVADVEADDLANAQTASIEQLQHTGVAQVVGQGRVWEVLIAIVGQGESQARVHDHLPLLVQPL
jgi:hypothetical protein